ncbi:VWA domain containing CoxE-like protein [Chitinophaga terrae (ex Kim and Jung 2007)]|uniref:VWA domain containing CoxE-like protein n=1 Tax=Chitinophaga terrae (ex Kim and Jung 2007) TaxID=408074 RepID=A0A1H4EP61_9BACT|nr:VWA domain-containing protein [Chitinophaga terrae (ex Kim and Jung 2007)]GEP91747.1 VWA domain-containing protein [Chitinophaga terrae (ex Kim and Jung 2007)]SEA86290.1 VWA domain containing CoxE-like protein [Chitinophaga terrae (ex Kim and Jung 2007)]
MGNEEQLRRWRLILGGDQNDGTSCSLDKTDLQIDKTLEALYDSNRKGGLGASSPNVSRWLGDIRTYFPSSVVQVMQKDALKRLNLTQMLLEKEMLQNVAPDVHLVATLMTLSQVIPEKTKDTARQVVRTVVDELMRKLAQPTQQAITGSLNRSARNRRPRKNEIDWKQTIQQNLKHYQEEYKTIIPETLIGYGRKRSALKEVVLCLDQSGSMGTSVVYSGIFGAVMASIPALKTQMVVFDTAVADLTEELQDPVELLFGVQLGGGTDINAALQYCEQIITRPSDTVLVLITDLYEGGNENEMRKRFVQLSAAGIQVIVLLALNNDGAPSYDHENAQFLANLGIPVFACTPDKFPDMMAMALSKQDTAQWAAKEEIMLKK